MKAPGGWLYRIAAQHLDAESVQSLIVPTIADLQHEYAEAGPNWGSRTLALFRGYIAVVRLVTHPQWRPPMRSLLVVFFLGVLGAVSAIAADSMTSSWPAFLVPVMIVAAVSVAVLRFMKLGLSYSRALLNCVGIGLLMMLSYTGWLIFFDPRVHGIPWYGYPLILGFLVLCVGFGGALAAAVVWEPPIGTRPVLRTISILILTGCGVFALAQVVVGLLWSGGTNLVSILGSAVFMFFFFAAVASVLYVPILFVAGRLIRVRWLIAVIGASLFPIPWLGLAFLQGHGPSYVRWVFALPALDVIAVAIPYVLGGAVIGWLLATRQPEHTRSA